MYIYVYIYVYIYIYALFHSIQHNNKNQNTTQMSSTLKITLNRLGYISDKCYPMYSSVCKMPFSQMPQDHLLVMAFPRTIKNTFFVFFSSPKNFSRCPICCSCLGNPMAPQQSAIRHSAQ